MPAALVLGATNIGQVDAYLAAMGHAGRRTGRSTTQAAKSFCAKLERAGGWSQMSPAQQVDAIGKAPSFASWLMVTRQLTINADVLGRVDLRLGNAARTYCPQAHAWFRDSCRRLHTSQADIALQWNTLAKITAVTGTPADRVGAEAFEEARAAIINAYLTRGRPNSGRNMAAIFHRLQLTLFHAGNLDSHTRVARRPPVSVTGWAAAGSGFAETARRYVAQVELSLRPSTVKHIEHDLREFGTWLAHAHPGIEDCAGLTRTHVEDYKAWLGAKHGQTT
jgi:integrase/recombinase XerD